MRLRFYAMRAVLAGMAFFACATAQAQEYPARPVTIVEPFPPGGAGDVVVRYMAQEFTKSLGGSFIVDNRAGAAGSIGTEYVARAAPDGYTLLLTSASAMSINPYLTARRTYDPFNSFTPIVNVAYATNELVVTTSLPYKSVAEVIAAAKAEPGKLAFASNGAGTLSHLIGEMFMQQAGVRMLHVPYKGAAPAVADTVAGQTAILFTNYASVTPMVKAGKLRGLAITSLKPTPLAPGLPAIAQSGLPGFEAVQWWGLWGPTGLPPAVVQKLNAAANKIMANPGTVKYFAAQGVELSGGTPADLTTYLRADYNRWGQVIKTAGIKPE
ncbi:MAG: tripartite tricarboxylate transporter substrate binding protein [Betaproteobacteria bacterium]|nr:tripartite tricarboxylate transporter substrate binding protein [Betaproteobacteria bacterium]